MRTAFLSLTLLCAAGGAGCTSTNSTVVPPPQPPFSNAEQAVYAFPLTGGNRPVGGLLALGGTLYGTAAKTSNSCCGAVYGIKPDGSGYTTLHSFNGTDGTKPQSDLILYGGRLWGTATDGGGGSCPLGCGTVFSVDPNGGGAKVEYTFNGGTHDGAYPYGGLVAMNGLLYGTTINGGIHCPSKGCGTIFEINPASGKERLIFRFDGSDGAYPYGNLIAGSGGVLYGTTANGGDACPGHGCGTVFEVHATQRSEKILHRFAGGTKDGAHPFAGLVRIGSELWGTTVNGGTHGYGTAFAVNTSPGKEVEMYSFKGGSDGAYPRAALVAQNGTLYGTTTRGGGKCHVVNGCGTVFSLVTANGAETVLHAFASTPDGHDPFAVPIVVGGKLYGTTESGGIEPGCNLNGCGTIYSVTI